MASPHPPIWLTLLTMFSSAAAAADGRSGGIESVGVPSGFGELTREHEMLVDVYYGGRKIGEAMVIARPGSLRFKDSSKLLAQVPNLDVSAELSEAFEGDLPTNAGLVCPQGGSKGCGELSPQNAGIIFDEDRFRVDLFINPRWLQLVRPEKSRYLATPTASLSLTSAAGVTLSGSSGTSPVYNFQNRTIIGFHDARVRTDLSYSSGVGLLADTLVGEVDRPGIRYSAGLFWAPGLDLTGERRIVGLGIETQFDTRKDRDNLEGTPRVLYLAQPARVDILVDGRIVSSRSYEAGNNLLDTSSLSQGSYSLVLRIHEQSGAVREERRFFAKDQQIAPVGQPIYFAYAGKLANTRPGQAINLSRDFFYQVGTARRLSQAIAVDFSVIGTSDKPIVEAGGWLITPVGRVRAAALASASGDKGALLQVTSARAAGFSLNFDVRRIWSHDGKPLIPLSTYVDTFDSAPVDGRLIGNGSFTQASGSIGYQLGTAYLALIGSLRKDEGVPADYSIGPNINWPFVSRNGLQIALQADAEVTRTARAGYVGVRMLFSKGAYSVSNSIGGRGISGKGSTEASRSRVVGDTTAQFSYADDRGTDLSVAGGLTRDIDSTAARAETVLYSRFGNARVDLLHNIEGDARTQYGLTLQTGALIEQDDAVLGGRDLTESALVVSVEEDHKDASEFEVLINGQTRARLKPGERLPIFLQPYRAYSVRLKPLGGASVWYDSAAREFTLYPGNVQHVSWSIEHLVTIFGRAVHPGGEPVANAMIISRRGLGESNSQGYFEIETSANDVLSFDPGEGAACKVTLAGLDHELDYHPVGKVVCQ